MGGNKFKAGIGVGTTMLILIFGILCLTVFATLALVSANNDKQLAEKTEGMISAYYHADSEIEEALQQVTEELELLKITSSSDSGYIIAIENAYGEAFDSSESTLNFTKVINDQLMINLVLQVNPFYSDEGLITVTERNIEAYSEFKLDNSLNIWTGEETE